MYRLPSKDHFRPHKEETAQTQVNCLGVKPRGSRLDRLYIGGRAARDQSGL
ncbi:MAG: hypothetical protein A07HR60_01535 [uncultured archaeon A07HR60]|nr:MAG: hypothetical protein A07HR60_01535 [uncultured archaeon A07HR60]